METEVTKTGTTLAVLQHYLDAGIDVYMPPYKEWPGGPAKLTRLQAKHPAYPEGFVYGEIPGTSIGRIGHKPSVCLPYLKPFRALCDKLQDGAVPAVEAMKALPIEDKIDWTRANASITQPAKYSKPDYWLLAVFAPLVGEEKAGYLLRMSNDWVVSGGEPTWERLYLSALLTQHAAVGLEPHQYIEKQ